MDDSDTASTNITNYPEDLQSNENSKDQANFLMKTIQTKQIKQNGHNSCNLPLLFLYNYLKALDASKYIIEHFEN